MQLTSSIFEKIEANLRELAIDDIVRMLRPLVIGYEKCCPTFESGTFLYRARKLGASLPKQEGITRQQLSYPPKEHVQIGRVNRAGAPVFYSSMAKGPVFFEMRDVLPGEEFILTFWRTNKVMMVNSIGYTEETFKQLGATRTLPPFETLSPSVVSLRDRQPDAIKLALERDENHEVNESSAGISPGRLDQTT